MQVDLEPSEWREEEAEAETHGEPGEPGAPKQGGKRPARPAPAALWTEDVRGDARVREPADCSDRKLPM